VVGVPTLGALAAAESGIALDRLALVPNPGPEWPTVVAALIDGVDVVVVAVPGPIAPTIASRLVARARQRGCVLMPLGQWAGADVSLQVTRGIWEGLGAGHGRLRRREVTVTARGRGAAARPKEITMWMPGSMAPPPIPPAPNQPIRKNPHPPTADAAPNTAAVIPISAWQTLTPTAPPVALAPAGLPAPGLPAPGLAAPGLTASGLPAPGHPAPGHPSPGHPTPGQQASGRPGDPRRGDLSVVRSA
jgi:hypothetical protein